MKALCIIYEGAKPKTKSDREGYIYDISNIHYLKEKLEYAQRKDAGVLYLSYSNGIVFKDEKIKPSANTNNKYSKEELEAWSKIVCGQLIYFCMLYKVKKIYLLCTAKNNNIKLIKMLKESEINVITPIVGCKKELIKYTLENS